MGPFGTKPTPATECRPHLSFEAESRHIKRPNLSPSRAVRPKCRAQKGQKGTPSFKLPVLGVWKGAGARKD